MARKVTVLVAVRLDPELAAALKKDAARAGRSMGMQAAEIVRDSLDRRGLVPTPIEKLLGVSYAAEAGGGA